MLAFRNICYFLRYLRGSKTINSSRTTSIKNITINATDTDTDNDDDATATDTDINATDTDTDNDDDATATDTDNDDAATDTDTDTDNDDDATDTDDDATATDDDATATDTTSGHGCRSRKLELSCHNSRWPAACRPAPGHAVNKVAVAAQGQQFLARGRIPHFRVPTGGGQPLAVRAPGHAVNKAAVAAQSQQFLMVIDLLNIGPSFRHQFWVCGGYSRQVADAGGHHGLGTIRSNFAI